MPADPLPGDEDMPRVQGRAHGALGAAGGLARPRGDGNLPHAGGSERSSAVAVLRQRAQGVGGGPADALPARADRAPAGAGALRGSRAASLLWPRAPGDGTTGWSGGGPSREWPPYPREGWPPSWERTPFPPVEPSFPPERSYPNLMGSPRLSSEKLAMIWWPLKSRTRKSSTPSRSLATASKECS